MLHKRLKSPRTIGKLIPRATDSEIDMFSLPCTGIAHLFKENSHNNLYRTPIRFGETHGTALFGFNMNRHAHAFPFFPRNKQHFRFTSKKEELFLSIFTLSYFSILPQVPIVRLHPREIPQFLAIDKDNRGRRTQRKLLQKHRESLNKAASAPRSASQNSMRPKAKGKRKSFFRGSTAKIPLQRRGTREALMVSFRQGGALRLRPRRPKSREIPKTRRALHRSAGHASTTARPSRGRRSAAALRGGTTRNYNPSSGRSVSRSLSPLPERFTRRICSFSIEGSLFSA